MIAAERRGRNCRRGCGQQKLPWAKVLFGVSRPDFRLLEFKPWERRALSCLLLLIMAAVGAWSYFRYQPLAQRGAEDFELYQWWLEEERLRDSLHLAAFRSFDPNLCSDTFLQATGMPEKARRMFLNYRAKGGQFYATKDLAKLYAMDSLWLSRALPYARFPSRPTKQPYQRRSWKSWQEKHDSSAAPGLRLTISLDLNRASAEELERVPGIGPFRAQEILRLRKAYGGFHRLKQLAQLYKVDSTDLAAWRDQLYCGPDRRFWDLNAVVFDSLVKLPGFDRRTARSLIAFRDNIRPFLSVDELRLLELVDEGLFAKIAPYFYVVGKNGTDSAKFNLKAEDEYSSRP